MKVVASGSSAPHGGGNSAGLPALASGTSNDFSSALPLPQALRGRRCLFIMGPPGVGKTRVARALAGGNALEWSSKQVQEVIAAVHRGAAWPESLQSAQCAILDCPDRVATDPAVQAGVAEMLRLREASDGWTAMIQSRHGAAMTNLMTVVAPERRASIALRFPVGDERVAFAQSLCAQHGLSSERAAATATIEPWSYTAVWDALGLSTATESLPVSGQE